MTVLTAFDIQKQLSDTVQNRLTSVLIPLTTVSLIRYLIAKALSKVISINVASTYSTYSFRCKSK